MHNIYPFEDGDFVVLGPETFVTRDGQVVYWRGFAYQRVVPVFVDPLDITNDTYPTPYIPEDTSEDYKKANYYNNLGYVDKTGWSLPPEDITEETSN